MGWKTLWGRGLQDNRTKVGDLRMDGPRGGRSRGSIGKRVLRWSFEVTQVRRRDTAFQEFWLFAVGVAGLALVDSRALVEAVIGIL